MPFKMQGDKIFYDCFLCDRPFQFGPHVYDGRFVRQWEIEICDSCIRGNWDGIVIEGHPRLEAHLKAKGIPITRNARGWVDIPPR
jgi:hypothetical protein